MHHTRHQVKYLMSNLFPKVRKYERLMGCLNQCYREHPKKIRTRHSRDKRTTNQIDRFFWKPHQNHGDASSKPFTLIKSIGPSTIHPDHEPSAKWNSLPQLAATNVHSPPLAFMEKIRPVDQPSSSWGKPIKQKIGKDKTQWDLIPITYTELLPKLIESGFTMFDATTMPRIQITQ